MRLTKPREYHCLARPHNQRILPTGWKSIIARSSSTKEPFALKASFPLQSQADPKPTRRSSGLSRLPTNNILRSLALGAFLSSPILFKPGLALLSKISRSRSPLLNPDKNPVLRAIVKPLIYDQFCAGRDREEIRAKVSQIKSLGFSGVILCYGRENQIYKAMKVQTQSQRTRKMSIDEELECWKQGNLDTLDMVGDGDWLGIK